MTKYIFVTGGVVSGLGKGITAASLGRLLKQRGLKVVSQKLDPYMNADPGTMSPFQHGEVFVTEDGAETDLDLGHYERFIDENLSKFSNITSGKIYFDVISAEREGKYLGQTVQVIPHITNEIKNFIYLAAKKNEADILICEIGGTVGDIESLPFLEAIRQISLEQGRDNCLFIHVTLVPYLKGSNEHKSKPTQHSVKELRSLGISPNIIVTRSDEAVPEYIKSKISLFCNVEPDCVVENSTLDSLYQAPLMLHKNGLDKAVCRLLNLNYENVDLQDLEKLNTKIENRNGNISIAIVGKYVQLHDAYLSVMESLYHAGIEHSKFIDIKWIDSEKVTSETVCEYLENVNGIVIPGGFGNRGIEGKITTIKYARENNIPLLGICLGMQMICCEFARNVVNLANATSTEFNEKAQFPIIDIMEDQVNITQKGGTMRLGAYPCDVKENTLLHSLYKEKLISERHRHRFEFNNTYRELLSENGLVFSGLSPDGNLVEVVEIPEHKFFIGVQYHPEFKSRPDKPHPLFSGLIKACLE